MLSFSKLCLLWIIVADQVHAENISFTITEFEQRETGSHDFKYTLVFKNGKNMPKSSLIYSAAKYGYACIAINQSFELVINYNDYVKKTLQIFKTTNSGSYTLLEGFEYDRGSEEDMCLAWGTWVPETIKHEPNSLNLYLNFIGSTYVHTLQNVLFVYIRISNADLDVTFTMQELPKRKLGHNIKFNQPESDKTDLLLGKRGFKINKSSANNDLSSLEHQIVSGHMDVTVRQNGYLQLIDFFSNDEKELIKKGIKGELTADELKSPLAWNNIECVNDKTFGFKFRSVKAAGSKQILI